MRVILDWLLEKTAPWWMRDILRRERALSTLQRLYEKEHHGKAI